MAFRGIGYDIAYQLKKDTMISRKTRQLVFLFLALASFCIPFSSLGQHYRRSSSPNQLTVDPHMNKRHQPVQRSSPKEDQTTRINNELIAEYERFQFANKYNQLVTAFNELKDDIDIEDTKQLLEEFQNANFYCYKLIYSTSTSPDSKRAALKKLDRKYQELVSYKNRRGNNYVDTLKGRIWRLQSEKNENEKLIESLNDDLEKLSEKSTILEGTLKRNDDDAKRLVARYEEQIDSLCSDLEKADKESESFSKKLNGQEAELSHLKKTVAQLHSSLRARNIACIVLGILLLGAVVGIFLK